MTAFNGPNASLGRPSTTMQTIHLHLKIDKVWYHLKSVLDKNVVKSMKCGNTLVL